MLLDDVAADFPELTIVLAHSSVPWQDSAISMAVHKANVFIDRWLSDFEQLEIKPDVRSLILKENAVRVLDSSSNPRRALPLPQRRLQAVARVLDGRLCEASRRLYSLVTSNP
jgi:hypothetical protein